MGSRPVEGYSQHRKTHLLYFSVRCFSSSIFFSLGSCLPKSRDRSTRANLRCCRPQTDPRRRIISFVICSLLIAVTKTFFFKLGRRVFCSCYARTTDRRGCY
ncbi:hypothetical protein BS78_06G006300 [Paspalum vaginatum]|nr:hypothetical protein BS78_06G006300 [Paspalum vaginatum]